MNDIEDIESLKETRRAARRLTARICLGLLVCVLIAGFVLVRTGRLRFPSSAQSEGEGSGQGGSLPAGPEGPGQADPASGEDADPQGQAEGSGADHAPPDSERARYLTRFGRKTPAKEFAELIAWMFETGTPRVSLAADGGMDSESAIDEIFATLDEAEHLADEMQPLEGSVYGIETSILYTGDYLVSEMSLALRSPSSEDLADAAEHVRAVREYCAKTADELLAGLPENASYQEKARLLYDRVLQELNYDSAQEIHDAYLALRDKIGVCECYTAIYTCMCRTAGIPSRGMVGTAGSGPKGALHIWVVQETETGELRYTDPTWGDAGDPEPYFWAETLWESHRPLYEEP